MNDIVNLADSQLADLQHKLVLNFLAGKARNTARAYSGDFRAFGTFCGTTGALAIESFVQAEKSAAFALVLKWRTAMLDNGLAPATINRRLSALRSVVKLARMAGMVDWHLEIDNVPTQAYRDTSGPGVDVVKKMLALAVERSPREYAVFRLLFDLGLRRSEVADLQLSDIQDRAGQPVVMVAGKGRHGEQSPISLPRATAAALIGWLQVRGEHQGPLFLDMKDHTIYYQVKKYSKLVGCETSPHGLRHTAITEAARITGGDAIKMRQFSRHKSLQTLLTYIDNDRDDALEIGEALSGDDD